jgi:hypothetical protein
VSSSFFLNNGRDAKLESSQELCKDFSGLERIPKRSHTHCSFGALNLSKKIINCTICL